MRLSQTILLASIALALTASAEQNENSDAIGTVAITNANDQRRRLQPEVQLNTNDNISSDESLPNNAGGKDSQIRTPVDSLLDVSQPKTILIAEHFETAPDGTLIQASKAVYSMKSADGAHDAFTIEKLAQALQDLAEDKLPSHPQSAQDGNFNGLLAVDIGDDDDGSYRYRYPDWDYIPLYGDTGYRPRPLPERPPSEPSCPRLSFFDQMIWDQQRDRGVIVVLEQNDQSPDELEESFKISEIPAPPVLVTRKPEKLKKRHNPAIAPSTEKGKKGEKKEREARDEKKKGGQNKKFAKVRDNKTGGEGLFICSLGPCQRIRHRQRKFLRRFRGRALLIDAETSCPIPSFHYRRYY
ncbi:hypothetical protein EDD11_009785 [Mortierella claussenii]|nr:hypothetical protein EDD11_009785 [Mortierella claussenii]